MKTLLLSAVLAIASLSVSAPTAKADPPAQAAQTLDSLRADLAAKDAYIVKLEAYADALELRLSAVEAKLAAVQPTAPAPSAGLDLRPPSVQRAYAAEAAARAAPAPNPFPAVIQVMDRAGKVLATGHGSTAYGPGQVYLK